MLNLWRGLAHVVRALLRLVAVEVPAGLSALLLLRLSGKVLQAANDIQLLLNTTVVLLLAVSAVIFSAVPAAGKESTELRRLGYIFFHASMLALVGSALAFFCLDWIPEWQGRAMAGAAGGVISLAAFLASFALYRLLHILWRQTLGLLFMYIFESMEEEKDQPNAEAPNPAAQADA